MRDHLSKAAVAEILREITPREEAHGLIASFNAVLLSATAPVTFPPVAAGELGAEEISQMPLLEQNVALWGVRIESIGESIDRWSARLPVTCAELRDVVAKNDKLRRDLVAKIATAKGAPS